MSEPYEIIIAPFQVYTAPVGTAFPDVDETPGTSWALLGTHGKDNIADAGVTVTHNQTLKPHRNAGSTGAKKVVRTEEDLEVSLTLEDLTLEQYGKVLNNTTVSSTAAGVGTPGYKSITLHQGNSVSTFALLVRGVSAYGDGYNCQYKIPVCYQADNPAPVFNKSDAASLKCTFKALEDPSAVTEAARFGTLDMGNANAL